MYYDTHTHLNSDKLYPERQKHLQTFGDLWGKALVNIGVNQSYNLRAIDISQASNNNATLPSCYATVGIHPCETLTWGSIESLSDIDREISLLTTHLAKKNKHIVALGECGIDSYYERNTSIQDLQTTLFVKQCILAQTYKLPIVIHSRNDFALTYDILSDFKDLKVYFHCRGYEPSNIEKLASTFPHVWIWFCGNITYKKADIIRNSFTTAKNYSSLGNVHNNENNLHILLETDAPYLSPQTKRNMTNTPAHIIDIYRYVASTFDIPMHILQSYLAKSFSSLYQTTPISLASK